MSYKSHCEECELPTLPMCEFVDDGSEGEKTRGGPQLQDIQISAKTDDIFQYLIPIINTECRKNWRNVEFEIEGMPTGATSKVLSGMDATEIRWTPQNRDIGEHHLRARVRAEGYAWNEVSVTVVVTQEDELFFTPGVQYSLWVPEARDVYGVLQGVSLEYLVVGWIHRNENRGPSHGRFYLDIDFLRSSVSPNLGLAYSAGIALSFERNPKRQFLIPFFGMEFGGIYQKLEERGKIHSVQINPLGGVNLWASKNIFINVTVGYLVPFSQLEDLRGLRFKSGINFSFW